MKYFTCANCDHQIFFEHSECEHCHALLGYVSSLRNMLCFKPIESHLWQAISPQCSLALDVTPQLYKPCYNHTHFDACNWVLSADDPEDYCESCQLTHTIPQLEIEENLIYWRRIEKAKRRFLYLAQRMNMMPLPKRDAQDRFGLRYDFLMPIDGKPVMTGHAKGIITLNASEADVVYRETTRVKMGENYRTLLGHFRHESGHHYFDIMSQLHPELLDEFRAYFGDERQDYGMALKKHYEEGPPDHWQDSFISSYATTHPWEDWAETWSHYLHMMDTLETAYYAGLRVEGNGTTLNSMDFKECPIGGSDFEHILENWQTLTFNLNALNRSMGLEDAYPFKLSEKVKDKLRFIHRHVLEKAFASTIRVYLATNIT